MPVEFSAENQREVDKLLRRYPTKRAACIPLLHLAQKQFGYLSIDALELVARTLDLSPAEVFGTASFYTMFRFKPEGRHQVEFCTNLSCMLLGAEELVHHAERRLGCKLGETTQDGMFTIREVECLAACNQAPCIQLDEDLVGPLDGPKLDKLFEELRARARGAATVSAPAAGGPSGEPGKKAP